MSAGKPFFDTNVLLYLLSTDAKADQAESLLAGGGVVSVQVLNEFVSVALRKLKMKWPELREILATGHQIAVIGPGSCPHWDSVHQLQKVHAMTHPAEKAARRD
jgi:predicted nucleic acid-binding protein